MLSKWHWKVIDPPIRTERMDSSENKIKIVRMILHIVINLSKQPPLAVKKTLENLQVGKSQHQNHPSFNFLFLWQEKMMRFVADAAMMESILRDSSLMDPYQYIQQVLHQRGVTLDTESVWPVPQLIFSLQ